MSDSSKSHQQRPGATPIKNPLLSASVTGFTFDDLVNKPQLLPAAPPIVHLPPTPVIPPTTDNISQATLGSSPAVVTPTALLGREHHKSLVILGSSSLDTENLDEINLNSSNEDSSSSVTGNADANANSLLEQTPTSDSILSQAASSFSALPSVASNVFSSFSKRITAISSRETTPVYDQQASGDTNANYPGPQLDIQPNYTQQQVPVVPEPFYAPSAVSAQSSNYFGSLPPTTGGLADTQSAVPPTEPPKFYTPAEVPTLPLASAVPPPPAGGQNNFRFAAKKKLYAPIPGLSDQNQVQPAPTFDPNAISSPPGLNQPPAAPYSDTYAQPSYPQEERKQIGGLFSKITNLAPTGVLQNITGLVQSAAGTITQTIKPESAYENQQQYQATGLPFDQQQQQTLNYFAGPPPVGTGNYFNPQTSSTAPSAIPQATPSAVPQFFNPQTSAEIPGVPFYDPSKSPQPPTLQTPGNYFQDPYQPIPVAPPPSAASSQPSRPPSHPSRPTSQPGPSGPLPVQPPPIAGSLPPSRPPSQPGVLGAVNTGANITAVPPLAPVSAPPVAIFDPTQQTLTNPLQAFAPPPVSNNPLQTFAPPPLSNTPLQSFGPPPPTNPLQTFAPPPSIPTQSSAAAPPIAGALPPPSGGQTSFRLQKGTRLYKNPLTAQETAPVQVTPNQIAGNPVSQQQFVPPSIGNPQNFAPPPPALTSTFSNNFGQIRPQGQNVPPPSLGISNFFNPSVEAQSYPSSGTENQTISESIPLFSPSTGEVISATEQSVPLFAAPIEEPKKQNSPPLLPPSTEDLKAEDHKKISESENIPQTKDKDIQQIPEAINPEHFFKPIEPVVESVNSGYSSNFFGSNENYQELFKPIEPVFENQEPEKEFSNKQEESVTATEEALKNLNIEGEPQNIPTESEKDQIPKSEGIPPETKQNLPNITQSFAPPPQPLVDTKTGPLGPPPCAVATALGVHNPYRRGSATETAKPSSAIPPTLANFFTPGPSTGAGDFNFFDQQQQSDFFTNQVPQQAEVGQNFFNSTSNENKEPQQTVNQTQAINFFGGPSVAEINPQNPHNPSLVAGDTIKQQSPSFFGSVPYPSENSATQGNLTSVLPPLPDNIGIIPSVQESSEDIQNQQADLPFQGPPPPIGFENFEQQASKQIDETPLEISKEENSKQSDILNSALPQGNTPFPKENTTQQVIEQPSVVNNNNNNQFSNFFNPNPNNQTEITKDPSAFFDSFAGQQQTQGQQQGQISNNTPHPPSVSVASNEDQRIQNFFNNPPPKDAYHAGDLNYDLVHSGLAIRNFQQRSFTPVSNLVEPPSSACSEFSNLTLDTSSATENSNVKEDIKTNESNSIKSEVPDNRIWHELTPKIREELGMANLLQGSDKASSAPSAASVSYKPVVKHWFYKRTVDSKHIWTPFSHYDSALLETSLTMEGDDKPSVVAVEGGRYDAYINERVKRSVYWESEPVEIRRCSWFYKAIDSKYIPYEESTAEILEAAYKKAAENGEWHNTIILGMGEQIQFHGPTVIVHYQQQHNQDAWGGTTQSTTRPRVVKRDLDDFRIEQGESQKVDHLLFMVHGIGSACDLKLRSVEEVVDDFRTIAHQLVLSHYKNSSDMGLVGRVEVLPIAWHNHLHSLELGIDEKLRSITLESIPKLRNFTNDTLLDILFYTSPTFAQRIMNSIVKSLNDMYMKYRQRHPDFNGGVSLAGHSLGSLILFDLLCHQKPFKECEEKNLENPDQPTANDNDVMDSNQLELKQSGYTMGPAGTGQPFINYKQLVFQPKKFFALGSPVGMFVTIRGIDKLGLDFRLPTCPGFYNIFHPYDPVAYRIEALVNPDLSGCRPVLIPHHKGRKRMHLELKETMARVSNDLKNKFLDKFKNTLESVNFFGTTKSKKEAEELMEKEVEKVIEMQIQLERQDEGNQQQQPKAQQSQELASPSDEHLLSPTQTLRSRTNSVSTVISDDMVEIDLPMGKLNDSKRIDYVLQEAPLEFINEYLFALSSHVCYWDSEDTILFVMKEIYAGLGISPDSQVPQQTMTIERPSSRNSGSNS